MSVFKIGNRYRYVKHPDKPTGVADSYDILTGQVYVIWDNVQLIPPSQFFPECYFSDGTFEEITDPVISLVGGDQNCWNHVWVEYTGLREVYEYCRNCDMKRYKNGSI